MKTNINYLGDSEFVLKEQIDDNSIDMVVTSPPYDNLRKYNGVGDTWNHTKFMAIANELYRVLKPGGVIVWIVNDKTEKGGKTLTSFRQALYFQEIGFNVNDVMCWKKTNMMPVVKQPRYSDCFEYMFILSKGLPKTFNPIMIPCKCAGQKYDSTAKNMDGESGRHKLSYNVNKEKVKENIWEFAVAANKTKHPAVFPKNLIIDHIKSWSNEGDIVLDPFMGSGTTALACIDTNRQYIDIEMSEEYFEIINEQIKNYGR